MRLPALFAFAALVGLTACDSAKVSELTGAKPPAPQAAATQPGACPPAVNPACPSAVAPPPSMAPEPARTTPVTAATASTSQKTRRVAWTAPRAHHIRRAASHRVRAAARTSARYNAYAGGYAGEAVPDPLPQVHGRDGAFMERRYERPPVYARPDEGYDRRAYAYERREESSDQGGYRYERHDSGPPYVEDRSYRSERREDAREGYRYERREEGYSSSRESSSSYSSSGTFSDGCNCRQQAAGRDRQGFLTWPGKQP